MGIVDRASGAVSFALSQSSGFMEILRLKLRIIGFADKRSGLFNRLGETVYKNFKNGAVSVDSGKAISCIQEIRQTANEITEAEQAINISKEKAKAEREEFWRHMDLGSKREDDKGSPKANAVEKGSLQKKDQSEPS